MMNTQGQIKENIDDLYNLFFEFDLGLEDAIEDNFGMFQQQMQMDMNDEFLNVVQALIENNPINSQQNDFDKLFGYKRSLYAFTI